MARLVLPGSGIMPTSARSLDPMLSAARPPLSASISSLARLLEHFRLQSFPDGGDVTPVIGPVVMRVLAALSCQPVSVSTAHLFALLRRFGGASNGEATIESPLN